MTEKIERRGVHAPTSFEPDILQKVTAGNVMNTETELLSIDNTIKQVREWIKHYAHITEHYLTYVIVDKNENYIGLVSRVDVFNKLHDDNSSIASILKSATPHLFAENHLSLAVDIMDKYEVDTLPILSKDKKIIGTISHREIFTAYRKRRNENELYSQHISMRRQGYKIIARGKQLLKWNY